MVALLQAARPDAVSTVSISRDGRGRGGANALPATHFGNATLVTVAKCPPASAASAELAAALTAAVRHGAGTAQLARPADIHFTSWWHPLQCDLRFGGGGGGGGNGGGSPEPRFDVGPETLAVAARLCKLTGKANATVLPAPGGGLTLSLRVPRTLADSVVTLLTQRKAAATATAAVIWLHGLGDAAARWRGKFDGLAVEGGVRFVHPTAPTAAVTAHGAAHSSWFDVRTWPIGVMEAEPPAGIDAAIGCVR